MEKACRLLGYSRQSYYAAQAREEHNEKRDDIILPLVAKARKRIGKRTGCKTIYDAIKSDIADHGFRCGRDRFFDIMRQYGLLIKPKRAYRPKTTDSSDLRFKYPDLRAALANSGQPGVNEPERLLVVDITYVRLAEDEQMRISGKAKSKFAYISLVTDAFSRKIVGAFASDRLDRHGPMQALQQFLDNRQYPRRLCIHHSDRGSQYRSSDYVRKLSRHGLGISMTQDGNPLHNALAESVNGQLKDLYDLDQTFACVADVKQALAQAVDKYNHERPHGSLGRGVTPAMVHKNPCAYPEVKSAYGLLPQPPLATDTNGQKKKAEGTNLHLGATAKAASKGVNVHQENDNLVNLMQALVQHRQSHSGITSRM